MATNPIKNTKSNGKSESGEVATPRRFSKARQLSVRLGVCPKTIHRWGKAGVIHPRKVGARTVLYDELEVEAFIESTRVGAV